MGRPIRLWYSKLADVFSLMFDDLDREPTAAWQDELYEFRFHLIRGLRTGEIKGFSNDGGDLAQDYPRLMELLEARPVPGRFDAPDLGLTDATLPEIITAIYERYVVGRKPEFAYPIANERVPTLQVADREME
jgi:hypothetical protein